MVSVKHKNRKTECLCVCMHVCMLVGVCVCVRVWMRGEVSVLQLQSMLCDVCVDVLVGVCV